MRGQSSQLSNAANQVGSAEVNGGLWAHACVCFVMMGFVGTCVRGVCSGVLVGFPPPLLETSNQTRG